MKLRMVSLYDKGEWVDQHFCYKNIEDMWAAC